MDTATTSVISWNRRSAESTADHVTTSEPISRDGFLPQVTRPVFTLADAVTAEWFSHPISRPHFSLCCCLSVTTYYATILIMRFAEPSTSSNVVGTLSIHGGRNNGLTEAPPHLLGGKTYRQYCSEEARLMLGLIFLALFLFCLLFC